MSPLGVNWVMSDHKQDGPGGEEALIFRERAVIEGEK